MIEEKILSYDGVYGVHDLIVHDYGPGRCFVTAHAEVPSDTDIMTSHDLMDVIEQDFKTATVSDIASKIFMTAVSFSPSAPRP